MAGQLKEAIRRLIRTGHGLERLMENLSPDFKIELLEERCDHLDDEVVEPDEDDLAL